MYNALYSIQVIQSRDKRQPSHSKYIRNKSSNRSNLTLSHTLQ